MHLGRRLPGSGEPDRAVASKHGVAILALCMGAFAYVYAVAADGAAESVSSVARCLSVA